MEEDRREQPFVKPEWLGDVACYDARLAYTLLQSGKTAGGYVDVGGWETITLLGRWESGAADQTVNGQQLGTINADLWVRKISYTVRRPNAFAGSLFKAQSDFFNAKNPNIDFTLLINSFCRYLIAPQPTPLENIELAFECVCPAGLVLKCGANIVATFTNLRAFSTTNGEIPVEAAITLHVTRLPNGVYGSCDVGKAQEELRALGLLPPSG